MQLLVEVSEEIPANDGCLQYQVFGLAGSPHLQAFQVELFTNHIAA